MTYTDYLQHWGILGQRWGQKNGPPYPLGSSQMNAAERRADRKDARWAKRKYNKIYKKAYNASEKEMRAVVKELDRTIQKFASNRKLSKTYINAYNRKMAEIMNKNLSDLRAPSGKVVKFIAKRGELGVHIGLADEGYDMSQVKSGIYSSGRIAYKKKVVDKV